MAGRKVWSAGTAQGIAVRAEKAANALEFWAKKLHDDLKEQIKAHEPPQAPKRSHLNLPTKPTIMFQILSTEVEALIGQMTQHAAGIRELTNKARLSR